MTEQAAGVKGGFAPNRDLRGRALPDRLWACAMTTKDDARAERLAAALRDNLRRRKGQAREAKAAAPAPAITPEPDAP